MRTAPAIASLPLLLVLGTTTGLGQEPTLDEPEPEPTRGRVLLPYAYYTPETSVAGGVTSVWYFRDASSGAAAQAEWAPRKELVVFEHSAHLPFFAESEKFTQQLIRIAVELEAAASIASGLAGPGESTLNRSKTP
jgi:pimeloyl-ACP methyl ester carboxylesterase